MVKPAISSANQGKLVTQGNSTIAKLMSVFSKLSPSQLPAKAKQSLQLKEIKDAMGNVAFLFLFFSVGLKNAENERT